MRVSVPTIPRAILSANTPKSTLSVAECTERVANFLAPGNVALLTGAGVSVDSGIRAYRGHDGRYMNPNYKYVLQLQSRCIRGSEGGGKTYLLS